MSSVVYLARQVIPLNEELEDNCSTDGHARL